MKNIEEITEKILKVIKETDVEFKEIYIHTIIQKELQKEYMRGFETASNIALNHKL